MLDDTLAWPREQYHGAAWYLGHGLTVIGPGWHRLVRGSFGAVAETHGASVVTVRQKCALLEIRAHHQDRAVRQLLQARIDAITDASRWQCEGCGTAMSETPPGAALWRKHCAECSAIVNASGRRRERCLWESRGGMRWPEAELW